VRTMHIVCPVCAYANRVVNDYKPGSILSCLCGEYLEFVQSGLPPRVVEKATPSPPASRTASLPQTRGSG
jgi:hypothetical protein